MHVAPKKEWGNAEELPALTRAFTLEPGTTFPMKGVQNYRHFHRLVRPTRQALPQLLNMKNNPINYCSGKYYNARTTHNEITARMNFINVKLLRG